MQNTLVVAKPKLINSVFIFFCELVFKIHKNKTSNVSDNTFCFRWKLKMQSVIVVSETIVD